MAYGVGPLVRCRMEVGEGDRCSGLVGRTARHVRTAWKRAAWRVDTLSNVAPKLRDLTLLPNRCCSFLTRFLVR